MWPRRAALRSHTSAEGLALTRRNCYAFPPRISIALQPNRAGLRSFPDQDARNRTITGFVVTVFELEWVVERLVALALRMQHRSSNRYRTHTQDIMTVSHLSGLTRL